MAKEITTAVAPDAVAALAARCEAAHKAVVARLVIVAERATLDRNALAAATVRIEELERANAGFKAKLAALTVKVENVKAVSRDNDPFFVGLDYMRDESGDPTAYVDPVIARHHGQRIIAEREALKQASTVAPAAPVLTEDALPF